MKCELKVLKLKDVVDSTVCLRSINTRDPEYQALVQSIREYGVIEPIVVRRGIGSDGIKVMKPRTMYSVVSGQRRYNAACESGRETIPCNIIDCNDTQLLYYQIGLSKMKKEVKPIEFTKGLLRILASNPKAVMTYITRSLHVDKDWVHQRLGLDKLDMKMKELVDGGRINLANAYVLAKLPEDEHKHFVDRAMTMEGSYFSAVVFSRYKEIRNARRAKSSKRS